MIRTIAIIIISAFYVAEVDANPPAFQSVRRKAKKEREEARKAKEAKESEGAKEAGKTKPQPGSKGTVAKTKLAQGVNLYVFTA